MTAPVHPRGIELIKFYEGRSLRAYLCPAGVWTIGYGATYGPDGRRVTRDTAPIDEAGATQLLERDLTRFARAVDRLVVVPISGEGRGALTSFAFNLGAGALSSSTLLRRVNALEWDDVPRQLGRWTLAGGRRLAGLIRRRAAEADLFVSGIGG